MTKEVSQLSCPQDFKPRKQLGQHFLRQKSVLTKIIEAAALKKSDLVVEIGPGLGVLTEKLAQKAGRVIAIEKDSRLIPLLKEKFAKTSNVKIIEGDARKLVSGIWYLVSGMRNRLPSSNTKYNPSTDSGLSRAKSRDKILNTKYKVVANLPYYAATHLIRQFLESPCPPKLMVVMLQKEVAQRMTAKPSRRRRGYGGQAQMTLLGVAVQFYAKAKIIASVSKTAFWPKPKVDSAIIKLKTQTFVPSSGRGSAKRKIDEKLFFKIAGAGFSQPRKQILNNLNRGLKISKAEVKKWLSSNRISCSRRPAELGLNDWLRLTQSWKCWTCDVQLR